VVGGPSPATGGLPDQTVGAILAIALIRRSDTANGWTIARIAPTVFLPGVHDEFVTGRGVPGAAFVVENSVMAFRTKPAG
jgi:hypothetical protein